METAIADVARVLGVSLDRERAISASHAKSKLGIVFELSTAWPPSRLGNASFRHALVPKATLGQHMRSVPTRWCWPAMPWVPQSTDIPPSLGHPASCKPSQQGPGGLGAQQVQVRRQADIRRNRRPGVHRLPVFWAAGVTGCRSAGAH